MNIPSSKINKKNPFYYILLIVAKQGLHYQIQLTLILGTRQSTELILHTRQQFMTNPPSFFYSLCKIVPRDHDPRL